ncbi:hypothetical protein ACA910_018898 [Epithemia clementina (nom. ined.)]
MPPSRRTTRTRPFVDAATRNGASSSRRQQHHHQQYLCYSTTASNKNNNSNKSTPTNPTLDSNAVVVDYDKDNEYDWTTRLWSSDEAWNHEGHDDKDDDDDNNGMDSRATAAADMDAAAALWYDESEVEQILQDGYYDVSLLESVDGYQKKNNEEKKKKKKALVVQPPNWMKLDQTSASNLHPTFHTTPSLQTRTNPVNSYDNQDGNDKVPAGTVSSSQRQQQQQQRRGNGHRQDWNDQATTPTQFPPPPHSPELDSSLSELQAQLELVQQQIYQLHGGGDGGRRHEFNLNSPAQVARVLYPPKEEKEEEDEKDKTKDDDDDDTNKSVTQTNGTRKTNHKSTNKAALLALAQQGNRLAHLMLHYRHLQSLIRKQQQRGKSKEKSGMEPLPRQQHPQPESRQPFQSSQQQQHPQQAVGVVDDITEDTDPLWLVDASALIHRSFHVMRSLHRSNNNNNNNNNSNYNDDDDALPTGAVFGVCRTLNRLLLHHIQQQQQQQSSLSSSFYKFHLPRIVLVYDSKRTVGPPTFRHELYAEYKANRSPTTPPELSVQFPLVRQAVAAYGICQVEAPGYEADDVIATLATLVASTRTTTTTSSSSSRPIQTINIVSGDKDMMQLLLTTDEDQKENGTTAPSTEAPSSSSSSSLRRIQMVDPSNFTKTTTSRQVMSQWQIPTPAALVDLLALVGDAADNIPGVPGIGPKTAPKLLTLAKDDFSLETLLRRVDQVPSKRHRTLLQSHADQARLSKQLVTLKRDIPLDEIVILSPSSSSLLPHHHHHPQAHGESLITPQAAVHSPTTLVVDEKMFVPSSDSKDDTMGIHKDTTDFASRWIESLRMHPLDADRIFQFYNKMEFQHLKGQLQRILAQLDHVRQQERPPLPESELPYRRTQKATRVPFPKDYEGVPF